MRSTFCLLLLVLLSACSQMRYIGIETYNPAEVLYPPDVRKILIVNNAVPQPSDSGYSYSLMGQLQDTCRAYADSALFDACRVLGNAVFDTDFFQDVLLFKENIRQDDAFLTDKKLTQTEVKSLCDETGADAVISFDRLLFDMNKVVSAYSDGYLLGVIDVNIYGVVRSYIPSMEAPQLTVLITDSIFWAEVAPELRILNQILPEPDQALRAAGRFIGGKVYSMFVPHWNRETRWFYTGFGTHWKRATAYASSEKWREAFSQWERIFTHSSGWKNRAKSAANIALYYELAENMEKAWEWAKKSYEICVENRGAEDKMTQNQAMYRDKLQERIHADKKLNLQIGEK